MLTAGLLLGVSACAGSVDVVRQPSTVPPPPLPTTYTGGHLTDQSTVLRGVNVYDLAWYAGYHGTTFEGQPQAGYDYLARRGVKLVRLAFMWPALQSSLGAPLSADYLGAIRQQVTRAGNAGMKVVLDLHNGCHYPDPNPIPGHNVKACGGGVSQQDLNDVWLRLSQVFKGNPAVLAYDIMNEPNHMQAVVWQQFSQGTVNALRAAGDRTQLWIEGTSYSGIDNWVRDQPRPWITDPANDIVYSGHQYFADSAYPDGYNISDYPVSANRAIPDLQRFIAWCGKFQVRCSVGEVGWPSSEKSTSWQQWNALAQRWYDLADKARLPVAYFSATSAFDEPNAAYSAVHNDDGCGRSGIPACSPPPIDTAHSQAQVIEKHLTFR